MQLKAQELCVNVGSDIGEEKLQIKEEVPGLFRKEQEPRGHKKVQEQEQQQE